MTALAVAALAVAVGTAAVWTAITAGFAWLNTRTEHDLTDRPDTTPET